MTIKMLIDASHEEETRVAIVHGNRVEEFDYESSAKKQIKGNVYLAKITRVEPSLQAAFVEYGGNRHGFLAFSEIHPDYYQIPVSDRDALIAEEAAAYASLMAEEEEPVEKKPKRKPRRKAKAAPVKDSESEKESETTDKAEGSHEEAKEAESEDVAKGDVQKDPTQNDSIKDKPTRKKPGRKKTTKDDAPSPEDKVAASEGEKNDGKENGPQAPDTSIEKAEKSKSKPGKGSTTKAESVSEPETITEKVPSDEDDTSSDAETDPSENKSTENNSGADKKENETQEDAPEVSKENSEETSEDDDIDDDIDSNDSLAIDEEDAEEKLRIKIAKGLRRRYKIQEVIKKNQIVLIQVVKEERGNKGAALTTYLSLPGRYCVLMPNTLHGGGVSRKIANVGERKTLKKILSGLNMPSGIACIIRTAGHNRTKAEIKRDFDYLIRTWEGIRERTLGSVAPVLINEEGDLIKRSIRDLYTREIDEILVEGEAGYKTARSFMRLLMPSHARKVKHYTEQPPLLHRYQVENQLDSMYSPTVQLKSGGYIVINPTEALVSIDVNSGKATKEHNIEETARKTNLEAAEEIARQLRLRDMAGLIVIDFIDMEIRGNNRAVEQKMKECLKSDRARIQVGKISSFGLLEMSRQRLRAGVLESSTRPCPHCEGSGVIRSVETQVLHILRELEEEGIRGRYTQVAILLPEQTAIYLLNNKRSKLVELEEKYNFAIEVVIDNSLTESSHKLKLPTTDPKKIEKQGKATAADQRDEQTQKRPDRERPSSSRRNRQRTDSRKSRERTRDKQFEKDGSLETAAVISETRPETDTAEKPETKPRRRRRRSRRGPRSQTTETAATAFESSMASPSKVDAKAVEANQSGSERTEAHATGQTENEVKPPRRPYPPQARSRRKSGDSRKSKEVKSEGAGKNNVPAEKEKSSSPAAPVQTAPKEPVKETKTDKEGPAKSKKTGWWSRTFGR